MLYSSPGNSTIKIIDLADQVDPFCLFVLGSTFFFKLGSIYAELMIGMVCFMRMMDAG